jgi:acyl carrier protein
MKPSGAEVKAKLMDILATTMGVPLESVDEDFSAERCETWDSVRHLTLVLALEDHFGVFFEEDEIAELTNLPRLAKALEARLLG